MASRIFVESGIRRCMSSKPALVGLGVGHVDDLAAGADDLAYLLG